MKMKTDGWRALNTQSKAKCFDYVNTSVVKCDVMNQAQVIQNYVKNMDSNGPNGQADNANSNG